MVQNFILNDIFNNSSNYITNTNLIINSGNIFCLTLWAIKNVKICTHKKFNFKSHLHKNNEFITQ